MTRDEDLGSFTLKTAPNKCHVKDSTKQVSHGCTSTSNLEESMHQGGGHAAWVTSHWEQEAGRTWPQLHAWISSHKASGEQLSKLKLQCCTSCLDLHFRSLVKSEAGSSRLHTNYQ